MGATCSVLTLDRMFQSNEARLPATEVVDGVPVRRTPFVGGRRFFVPFGYRRLLSNYDVVHVHSTDMFFDLVGMFPPSVPTIATIHGGFFHTQFLAALKRVYLRQVTARTCRAYSYLLANSTNDLEIFEPLHPRVELVPNAVEPIGDFLASGVDILCLGRLASHKRLDRVLQVFARSRMDGARRTLHIVGPEWGVTHDDLAATARRLGIESSIVLHGAVSPERLREIAKKCGYFCSGSEYEGFGMSLVEAMSVGLVPLVHKNAAFQELMAQARVGRTADFARPDDAADALVMLMRDTPRADRERARSFASSFAWPALAERSLHLYQDARSTEHA